MNCKIIKINHTTAKEVLVYRSITDEEGEIVNVVEIQCFHQNGEDEHYQFSFIKFNDDEMDNAEMAKQYVRDFSKNAALAFATSWEG